MKYWLDTEFIDRRPGVHLISIGIVAEDGREYYAESDDYPKHLACDWIKSNVFPHLTGAEKPPETIRAELEAFLDGDSWPQFWLYYGAYDWVAFTQLWGRMVDAPEWALRRYYCEIKQLSGMYSPHFEYPPKPENAHNALADARWTRELYARAMFIRPASGGRHIMGSRLR